MIRRELSERSVERCVGVHRLGRPRRACRIVVDDRVQRIAVHVGLVDRACLGGGSELLQVCDCCGRQTGRGRDLVRIGHAAELALQRRGGATHKRDLRARVTRQRVEPAEFVEDRPADAHVAIRARLVGRAVEAQERFDQRELAGAREVITRDMDRQPAVEGGEHRVDDTERVGERDGRRLWKGESHGGRKSPVEIS